MNFKTKEEALKEGLGGKVCNGIILEANFGFSVSEKHAFKLGFKIEMGNGTRILSFSIPADRFGKELECWLTLFDLNKEEGQLPKAFKNVPIRFVEFPAGHGDLFLGHALEDKFASVNDIRRNTWE